MKKRILIAVTALVVTVALVGGTVALAAKPQDVIERSNGFPSGMHFNLNIHGTESTSCIDDPGGNSVFIPLYDSAVIQYTSNKKKNDALDGVNPYELNVIDPCAVSGDYTAKVYLPAKVYLDEYAAEATPVDGYRVFGRILGKPQNGKDDPEGRSHIFFSPNEVIDAYNIDDEDPLIELGVITWDAVYGNLNEDDYFYRFEDPTAQGKGRSKAVDMTALFELTGWIVDASLDTYPAAEVETPAGDGIIDINDVPVADYGEAMSGENRDFNNDGLENDQDIEDWLGTQGDLATEITEPEWIFNIADVVTTEGEVNNDGTKLFQIRFYPYFE